MWDKKKIEGWLDNIGIYKYNYFLDRFKRITFKREDTSKRKIKKIRIDEIKTFPVPFSLEQIKENIFKSTKTANHLSKEKIIEKAFKYHSQGNISEAAKYYQYFINQGFKDHRVLSNYGVILKDLGNLKEAELSMRKAIELNPDYAESHSNLGSILIELGKSEEAEFSLLIIVN